MATLLEEIQLPLDIDQRRLSIRQLTRVRLSLSSLRTQGEIAALQPLQFSPGVGTANLLSVVKNREERIRILG